MKTVFKVLSCIAGALVVARVVQNILDFCHENINKKYINSGEMNEKHFFR